MAALFVKEGLLEGKVIQLEGEVATIGRSSSCKICLPDARVSRFHAEVFPLGGGLYAVRDLKSRAGTFLNGSRIERERLLRAEDEIVIGPTTLVFLPAKEDATPPEAGSARGGSGLFPPTEPEAEEGGGGRDKLETIPPTQLPGAVSVRRDGPTEKVEPAGEHDDTKGPFDVLREPGD